MKSTKLIIKNNNKFKIMLFKNNKFNNKINSKTLSNKF